MTAVERDVNEANSLIPKAQGAQPFVIENSNGGLKKRFVVRGWPIGSLGDGDQRRFVFELHEDKHKILINRAGPETLTKLPDLHLSKKWDRTRNRCSLEVNGETLIPEEVSHLALEPMFFP